MAPAKGVNRATCSETVVREVSSAACQRSAPTAKISPTARNDKPMNQRLRMDGVLLNTALAQRSGIQG